MPEECRGAGAADGGCGGSLWVVTKAGTCRGPGMAAREGQELARPERRKVFTHGVRSSRAE